MSVSGQCCLLSGRRLRRADHSSRGVSPNIVCLSNRDASIVRRSWPSRGCCTKMRKYYLWVNWNIIFRTSSHSEQTD